MKKSIFLIALLAFIASQSIQAQTTSNSLMKVDYKSLVSRADLSYDVPVTRSEEGMPVGNGTMGSLVWTTPSAMHFQINRDDVFAMGCNTTSFPDGHTNYSHGCGYVDINFVDYGNEIFTGKSFNQHLSVFEGLSTVRGEGITAQVLAWNDKDVIATEIDDQRNNPSAINIDLRMLRYGINYVDGKNYDLTSQHSVQVQTGSHSATSRLDIRNGRIILIQEFREKGFYSASAVAIGITGRKSKASYYNELTVRLSAEPGKGKVTILTSSASSYNPKEDVADLALKQMDAAQSKSFGELLESNRDWWGNYWSKSFIHLHSTDGVADNIEKNYTYFLYIMGSCSRGDYMPGFRGMLWYTNGDLAMWGSQYWWNNMGFYFNGLTPANHPELLQPVFKTYSKYYDSYARAASQQWGSKGIWIPETTWFNGLEDLPDSIASEMRDLYLVKKPWEMRSKAFQDFAQNKNGLNSRWNWLYSANKKGPFAWVTHVMSTTAKISYLYWLNYAYYLDKDWLKTTGYPMIKGTVEFYRNFPNFYKGSDGKYHIRYINNLESSWGGSDTPEELTAIHAMFPIAIRASEILGVDADLRPVWKEILENLTPVPTAKEPAFYYDLYNIGSENKELSKSVHDAYKKSNPNGVNENIKAQVGNRDGVAAANLGLAGDVKYLLPSMVQGHKENYCDYAGSSGTTGLVVLRNRLSLREGPGAIECQRLGDASHTLYQSLLQSVPPSPGEDPVNHIFPAWPKEWDVQFTLAARDAFLISASMEKGQIEFVEVLSQKGGKCLVQNPWPGSGVSVYVNGKKSKDLSGKILKLTSNTGDTMTLVPKGKKLVTKVIN
jgi:hypothetical protein